MQSMTDQSAPEVTAEDRETAERFGNAWRMNAAGKFGLANLLAANRIAALTAKDAEIERLRGMLGEVVAAFDRGDDFRCIDALKDARTFLQSMEGEGE